MPPAAGPGLQMLGDLKPLSEVADLWAVITTFDCHETSGAPAQALLTAGQLLDAAATKHRVCPCTLVVGFNKSVPISTAEAALPLPPAFFRTLDSVLEVVEARMYEPITQAMLQKGEPPADWALPLHILLAQARGSTECGNASSTQPACDTGSPSSLSSSSSSSLADPLAEGTLTEVLSKATSWNLCLRYHQDLSRFDTGWEPKKLASSASEGTISLYTPVAGICLPPDKPKLWVRPAVFTPLAAVVLMAKNGIVYKGATRQDLIAVVPPAGFASGALAAVVLPRSPHFCRPGSVQLAGGSGSHSPGQRQQQKAGGASGPYSNNKGGSPDASARFGGQGASDAAAARGGGQGSSSPSSGRSLWPRNSGGPPGLGGAVTPPAAWGEGHEGSKEQHIDSLLAQLLVGPQPHHQQQLQGGRARGGMHHPGVHGGRGAPGFLATARRGSDPGVGPAGAGGAAAPSPNRRGLAPPALGGQEQHRAWMLANMMQGQHLGAGAGAGAVGPAAGVGAHRGGPLGRAASTSGCDEAMPWSRAGQPPGGPAGVPTSSLVPPVMQGLVQQLQQQQSQQQLLMHQLFSLSESGVPPQAPQPPAQLGMCSPAPAAAPERQPPTWDLMSWPPAPRCAADASQINEQLLGAFQLGHPGLLSPLPGSAPQLPAGHAALLQPQAAPQMPASLCHGGSLGPGNAALSAQAAMGPGYGTGPQPRRMSSDGGPGLGAPRKSAPAPGGLAPPGVRPGGGPVAAPPLTPCAMADQSQLTPIFSLFNPRPCSPGAGPAQHWWWWLCEQPAGGGPGGQVAVHGPLTGEHCIIAFVQGAITGAHLACATTPPLPANGKGLSYAELSTLAASAGPPPLEWFAKLDDLFVCAAKAAAGDGSYTLEPMAWPPGPAAPRGPC